VFIEGALTVAGDNEFHTLTTLWEKKNNLESILAVGVFSFQSCPLVIRDFSRTKNLSIGVSTRPLSIL